MRMVPSCIALVPGWRATTACMLADGRRMREGGAQQSQREKTWRKDKWGVQQTEQSAKNERMNVINVMLHYSHSHFHSCSKVCTFPQRETSSLPAGLSSSSPAAVRLPVLRPITPLSSSPHIPPRPSHSNPPTYSIPSPSPCANAERTCPLPSPLPSPPLSPPSTPPITRTCPLPSGSAPYPPPPPLSPPSMPSSKRTCPTLNGRGSSEGTSSPAPDPTSS